MARRLESERSEPQTDNIGTSGGQFVGFRYSTHAGDTNWQAVTADGSAQTVTDTGVAADTNMHVFRVAQVSGTGYEFYIDGNLVATNTTHLPSSGVGCFDIEQLDAPGASTGTPGLVCSYLYWWAAF